MGDQNTAADALRFVAALHGPVMTSLDGRRFDGEEFQDVEPDSFDEIVSRNVVCMTCQGYPEHPCATYTMATEALS